METYVSSIDERIRDNCGLLLHGDYSQGKSALGAICLKAAAARGIIGFWIHAKEIPHHLIKETRFDNEFTVYERALSVPLLMIDELQIRKNPAYTEFSAEDLIRSRVDEQKTTIVTTNVSLDGVKNGFPALFAVLEEAVLPVKVSGHNFRTNKRKKFS
jgi:DNA replication protein DnaC